MNEVRKKTRSRTFSGSSSRTPLAKHLLLVVALIMGLMPYASAVHAEEFKLARQAVTATKALSLGQAGQLAQAAKAVSPTKPAKAGLLARHAKAVQFAKLGGELEIGPEFIGQPVGAVKPPTVNIVSIGDKTVSGN